WRCCLLRCMSPLMADIVAKRFFASRRATLIQAARPLDSKVAHLEGAADFCNNICHKQTFEVRFTPDRPLFGGLRGTSAFRGPLLAGCTRGEERNHGAGERTGGEEIQTCLETAGRILDPA